MKLRKVFFMNSLLYALSRGQFFKKIFTVALQILSVLTILMGMVYWVEIWKDIFAVKKLLVFFGGTLFQAVFFIGIYMIAHTILIRASTINKLADSDYTVIHVTATFIKLVGEIYAWYGAIIAIGGGAFVIFARSNGYKILKELSAYMPNFKEDITYGFGIPLFIISGLLISFFVLVIFYLLSEALSLFVDIADSTTALKHMKEKKMNSDDSTDAVHTFEE